MIDSPIGHHAFPILEPDRVDQREHFDPIRDHESETGRQHAAHRVPDDARYLGHPQLVEETQGIGGQLLESILIRFRLGRLPESNLVRNDHSVTGRRKNPDGRFPMVPVKILAVQKSTLRPLGFSGGISI